ncbi:MAG: alanine-tRNA synthetase second additional domain-containing protein [Oscillospiraceae bacterium]|nr:alanine-tRNA synthetase second additional domain-containing protein [Oscillospiraceae bacterium]
MPYSARMQKSHLYSVFFAPRGNERMADLGMQIAQQYLSPFDKLIGLIGVAGSGKSMIIRGMFPGLELTNDDDGVNVRPLPLLGADDDMGFYRAHTYHIDVRFESAFKQMHELAEAILHAVGKGKRVVVEHFDLIYPQLGRNAHLLIGIGEEVIVTRPTLFGPKPTEISDVVVGTIKTRLMVHTAEDICEFVLCMQGIEQHQYEHSDVRGGFILSFSTEPEINIEALEKGVNELIGADVPVSFADESHIMIGDNLHKCTGPRMHVRSAGEIKKLTLLKELLKEPITERYLLVGVVGDIDDVDELNHIVLQV